jgi:hypothetical protein
MAIRKVKNLTYMLRLCLKEIQVKRFAVKRQFENSIGQIPARANTV